MNHPPGRAALSASLTLYSTSRASGGVLAQRCVIGRWAGARTDGRHRTDIAAGLELEPRSERSDCRTSAHAPSGGHFEAGPHQRGRKALQDHSLARPCRTALPCRPGSPQTLADARTDSFGSAPQKSQPQLFRSLTTPMSGALDSDALRRRRTRPLHPPGYEQPTTLPSDHACPRNRWHLSCGESRLRPLGHAAISRRWPSGAATSQRQTTCSRVRKPSPHRYRSHPCSANHYHTTLGELPRSAICDQ